MSSRNQIAPPADFAIRLTEIGQRFRLIQDRPDTLREAFTKLFRRRDEYQVFDALKNVSFEIGRGEVVGIIGRNGSGKSTLLKVIAGIYEPTQGVVETRGAIAAMIELGTGFHPELTGRENIAINGMLLGHSMREVREFEPRVIEFAELGDFIDSPVKQYSSGMYLRLAFAIATEIHPDILLIDEIFAVGDAAFQRKCVQRMNEITRDNKTVVFVAHNNEAMRKLCSRVLLINAGEVIDDGPPGQVVQHYEEMVLPPASLNQV
jgi:ABC-type polysaccharide/polyol phosphate transport system ATPase subunit